MKYDDRLGLLSKSKKHGGFLSMPKLVSVSLIRKIIESRLNKNKEPALVSKWSYSQDERLSSPERLTVSPCQDDNVFGSSPGHSGGAFREKLLRLELADTEGETSTSKQDREQKPDPVTWRAKALKGYQSLVHHEQAGDKQNPHSGHSVSRSRGTSVLQGNQERYLMANVGMVKVTDFSLTQPVKTFSGSPSAQEERHGRTQSGECLPDDVKLRGKHPQDPVNTHAEETSKGNEIPMNPSETAKAGCRLPNCTGPHQPEHWSIGHSTFLAYSAMRGPQGQTQAVPQSQDADLGDWIQHSRWKDDKHDQNMGSCHSLVADLQPPIHGQRSSSGGQQADQKEVFLVPRTRYKHIEPPASFKPEDHKDPLVKIPIGYINKLKRNARKDWKAETDDINAPMKAGPGILPEEEAKDDWDDDFVISDNEGDPMDGRISPCTFRLWAQGAKRWDGDEPETQKTKQQQQHPANTQSPKLDSRFKRQKLSGTGTERRREPPDDDDDDDDEESDAAVSYSLLGSDKTRRLKAWQRDVSKHALAEAMASGQRQISDGNGWEADVSNSQSRGTPEPYTESEVQSALHAEDTPILAGIDARLAEAVLLQRERAFNADTLTVQHIMLEKLAAELRIDYRKKQLCQVSASVEGILLLQQQQRRQGHRRESLYRSVTQHLRESENRVFAKRQEAQRLMCEASLLAEYEAHLEKRLRDEALRVMDRGVTDTEVDKMVWHLSGGGAMPGAKGMPTV